MKFQLITLAFLLMFSLATVSATVESLTLDDYVIDLEYDQEDVNSGETFRIEATVTNEAGETRTNIELELELDSPFDRVGDDTKDIGTLEDDESRTVSFRVEVDDNTEEDDYEIEVRIQDAEDADDSDDITIEVKNDDSDLIIGDKESSPGEISADMDDIKLTITIENTGNGDAEFVRGTLELPKGITSSGTFGLDANLGRIGSGDNKEIEFYIDTSETISEGNLEASLFLEYEEEDGDKNTKRITFDIPIKGKAQFSLLRSILKEQGLFPGGENTMYITIENVGSDKGEETTVRVFEHSDLPLEFTQKTSLIGDLNPGDSGTASIEFKVDGDADAKRYLIRAQTRSITNGEVTTEDFTIPITVQEAEEKNPIIFIFGLIILLMIGIVVVIARR